MGGGEKRGLRLRQLMCMKLATSLLTCVNYKFGVINMFQTQERLKRVLFIRTKHSVRIFRVIPFIRPQNNT